MTNLAIKEQTAGKETLVYLVDQQTDIAALDCTTAEQTYLQQKISNKNEVIVLNRYDQIIIVASFKQDTADYLTLENCRLTGVSVTKQLNHLKISEVTVINKSDWDKAVLPFVEGMALTNYQFLKYKKEAAKQKNSLTQINVSKESTTAEAIAELQHIIDGVQAARTLINEPLSYLTARQLSKEIKALGETAGFSVKVFEKSRIKAEKMGGLLAVNAGSQDPPTFNILEWKPKKAVNKQPIILVGKGVVYDTGGLSLKPTKGMDIMKCDMSGAAAVIGAFYALAKNKLPLHVVGLIPATDNRPGETAYVPGDVIQMHSGSTVEVLNTDAEGRMILADALSYAKSYKPQLVIDMATLTGSALAAIGTDALAFMGTADEEVKETMKQCGFEVYERLVEFPLWEEYGKMLRSDIADLKNIGGRFAGCITAGKFLEHFTDYPWIHIDLAMAWGFEGKGYRGKNGTGAGVRLFYQFLKQMV